MRNTVFKRLKSMRQLKSEFKWEDDISGDLAILIEGRGINDEMIHKFGDGVLYEFMELDGDLTCSGYHFTHSCVEEDWYYHQSWFEEELKDMFGDKDFLL
jgi:hypothetical protein